jgi:monofunctional biosynthetic peptidoglycan transglycosylase
MIKRFFIFIFKLFAGLFLFSILMVIIYGWVPVPFTPLMAIRAIEFPEEDIQHDWVPMEQISSNLQRAVIASEDQNFLNHNGFDIKAIEKALDENKKGNRVRGASSISQQTAKNVFLWPERSWLRKGLEVYFTFMIEVFWSKKRILEIYLNSIEMGKGIYGAEAAAQAWFRKPASKLSAYEAAAIAAVLPNPRQYRANPASNYINQRKNWISRQMQNIGPLKFN